ncbi:MAG: tetratricopeptide repeat protein [Verrucomicrobiales bacterium]
MKFYLSKGFVVFSAWLGLLGESGWAQEGETRSPIREVEPGGVSESPGDEGSPESDQPASGIELRGNEGEPLEMADTLFLPAEGGAGSGSTDLSDSAADGIVDEETISLASGAPRDEQLELMQLYEGLGQYDNAIAAADLVLKRDPNNKDALAGMVRLMVETGRSHQALRFCKKLLVVDPGVHSQGLMASAMIAAARVEEAGIVLDRMKAAHRGAGPFPFETLLGFVELDKGRKKEARAIFESIVGGTGYDAIEVDTAEKQLLLMDLDEALVWNDLDRAQASVARLRDEYAGEPETAAAEAVEMFLAGDEAGAAAQLAALRSRYPHLLLFPFLVQLADFSYAAGDFDSAEAAYTEALADPRTRPLAREAVIRNRAQMRIQEGGHASGGVGVINGDEGTLTTSQARLRKAVGDRWFLGGGFTRQDIDLDDGGGELGEDDRMEGWISAERKLSGGRYVEGQIGGSDAGVMGAVEIGKRARLYANAWSLGIAGNERANDSARLASLDGRQHRISGMYQRELTPRLVVTAEAIGRQVEIDGKKFGNGGGGEIDLAYRLGEEERRSNYFIAWSSSYEKFDRSGDRLPVSPSDADKIAAELIQPEYSRHGLELRHDGQWSDNVFTRAMAGIYYRADSSDVEASGGITIDWYFVERMRLYLDALYTSNGEAGNSGSGVIEAKIGVAKEF